MFSARGEKSPRAFAKNRHGCVAKIAQDVAQFLKCGCECPQDIGARLRCFHLWRVIFCGARRRAFFSCRRCFKPTNAAQLSGGQDFAESESRTRRNGKRFDSGSVGLIEKNINARLPMCEARRASVERSNLSPAYDNWDYVNLRFAPKQRISKFT